MSQLRAVIVEFVAGNFWRELHLQSAEKFYNTHLLRGPFRLIYCSLEMSEMCFNRIKICCGVTATGDTLCEDCHLMKQIRVLRLYGGIKREIYLNALVYDLP